MHTNPQRREERYEFLCREIDRLIERHKAMPTDDLKSRVAAEINACFREIDEMDQQAQQELEQAKESGWSVPGFGHHRVYPAIGAGVICVFLGVVFGVALLVLGGLLVLLATVSSLTRGRGAPQPEARRWEWKP